MKVCYYVLILLLQITYLDLINDIKYDFGASVSAFEPRGFTVPPGITFLSTRREDVAAYNIDLSERLADVKQSLNV